MVIRQVFVGFVKGCSQCFIISLTTMKTIMMRRQIMLATIKLEVQNCSIIFSYLLSLLQDFSSRRRGKD